MADRDQNELSKFNDLPLFRLSSRYSSRKFPLHALTVLSGHSCEVSTEYFNDGNCDEISNYAVWQLTLTGHGCLKLKNTMHELPPFSLMVVSIPGSHSYFLPPNSDQWEFVFLVLIGREAIRITKMIEHNAGNIFYAHNIPRTTEALHSMLSRLVNGAINDPFENSSSTYQLCMTLLAELGGKQTLREPASFTQLLTFLKQNLHRDISVEDMAAVSRLSRSHFSRYFKSEMGISPRLYLEDMRLKRAMELLYDKRLSVKETAAQCGIEDVNYFCRLFKKRYGISPGKYKDKEIYST